MKLEVFSQEIVPVGSVDAFTALRWTEKYDKCGSFELWCPATPENAEMLKEDNLLWTGSKSVGVIEIIQRNLTQQNAVEINVRGRLIECYLGTRTVWDMYTATNKSVSDIMREIVIINCIRPTNPDRIIPMLRLNPNQKQYGSKISIQRTGSDVLSVQEELSSSHGLGFSVDFSPREKSLEFSVLNGIDRTINQSIVTPVVFSSDTEDILSSTYFHNKNNLKTLALVAGYGEGAARKKTTVGSGSGLRRKELFVDARDLQETDVNGFVIPEAEYIKMLVQRGSEYLSERKDIENFDAVIKSFGEQQYVYGVDYNKGDLVTVQDKILGITVNARITEVERVYDQNGYSLNLVFGYSQPTLNNKLKFLGMEV